MRERLLRDRFVAGRRTSWNADDESRALPEGRCEPDVATHEPHEASRERQSTIGTSRRCAQQVEEHLPEAGLVEMDRAGVWIDRDRQRLMLLIGERRYGAPHALARG